MKFGSGWYGNYSRSEKNAKKLREIDILLDSMSRFNMERKIKEIRRIISGG